MHPSNQRQDLVRRDGFTLIELLIVVVVIGVLASVAIPRFQKARGQSFRAALVSDLKNVVTAQEIYWASSQSYASDVEALNIPLSPGVSVTFSNVSLTSWGASAEHSGVSGERCAVFSGGSDATPVAPADVPDRITCTF